MPSPKMTYFYNVQYLLGAYMNAKVAIWALSHNFVGLYLRN